MPRRPLPLSPRETADFIREMLAELADLSRQSGLTASAQILDSAIEIVATERDQDQP